MASLSWVNLLNTTRSKDLPAASGSESRTDGAAQQNEDSDSDTVDFSEDNRSPFERDRDRTLFSPPVRRLHDKAQVFPLEPNDSVRTRGTHSMEVANLARSIINRLRPFFKEQGLDSEQIDHIRSIAETCGILHDLGNPPFGHAGEKAMQDWFEETLVRYGVDRPHQHVYSVLDSRIHSDGLTSLGDYFEENYDENLAKDFLKFDGNAQTIRLITKLQMLADFSGLNLTAGTLAAALKYTARSDDLNDDLHAKKKPGFFFSERDIVDQVRAATGLGEARHPIAYIVEACDDMVYSVVDLEDGIKKQVITWEDLRGAFKNNEVGTDLIERSEENVGHRLDDAGRHAQELSRQGRDEARAQIFRTYAIGEHVTAVVHAFMDNYNAIMGGEYGREAEGELLEDGVTSEFREICKNFAFGEVFSSSDIITRESKGRRIIADLMEFFWEGARHTHWVSAEDGDEESKPEVEVEGEFAERAYNLMSENYKLVFERDISPERVEETGLPREYRQLQLVADYICGMTDGFAQSLHKDLFNG